MPQRMRRADFETPARSQILRVGFFMPLRQRQTESYKINRLLTALRIVSGSWQSGQERRIRRMEADMFYHGGMTLGYFTPPVPKERKARSFDVLSVFAKKPEPCAIEDQEREQELARAFITPWHLFY